MKARHRSENPWTLRKCQWTKNSGWEATLTSLSRLSAIRVIRACPRATLTACGSVDIDALLGKLEQAGVASTATSEPIAAPAPAVVDSAPVAPPPQPVPVAQPKAPEPQLISAPYPVANPLAENKPKEKKKKKKKEATDIEDPAWDAAAVLASKPRPPPQQSAASRNSLTDFSGDTQPIRMPEHVDAERSGFSGTNVLPNMPGAGNSQLMTNLLVMLGEWLAGWMCGWVNDVWCGM